VSASTFAPRPEPVRRAPAPLAPSHLRLVGAAERRERRLTRLVTGALVVAVFAGLFAIVALRVLLAQGQVDIDRLTASVEAKQATRQDLRMTVAELEAPAQIVSAARQRLGMVTPVTVTYLAPAPPVTSAPPVR
jgi:cell division protein FtsB